MGLDLGPQNDRFLSHSRSDGPVTLLQHKRGVVKTKKKKAIRKKADDDDVVVDDDADIGDGDGV